MTTGLIIALVVLYIWAGVSVCVVSSETMHQKEKSLMYPLIMLCWWLLPIIRATRGRTTDDGLE